MGDPNYPTEPYIAHLDGGAFLVIKPTPSGVEIGLGAGDQPPAEVPTKALLGSQQVHNLLNGVQHSLEEARIRHGYGS